MDTTKENTLTKVTKRDLDTINRLIVEGKLVVATFKASKKKSKDGSVTSTATLDEVFVQAVLNGNAIQVSI